MDRSFSIASTGSGAFRQYHNNQIRNSVSPSSTDHYSSASTPTSNILNTAAAFNLAFGKDNSSSFSQDSGSLQGLSVQQGSVGTFFRVPNIPIQQQQQQQPVIQQYYQKGSNNFVPVSGNLSTDTFGGFGGSDQTSHPLRANSSRRNCIQQVDRAHLNQRHHQSPSPGNFQTTQPQNYSFSQQEIQQHHIQQRHFLQEKEKHMQNVPNIPQMSSHHHQSNQNMNKNRYGGQGQANIHPQDNINSQGSNNVKQLIIQQISHAQHQHQNNDMNNDSSKTTQQQAPPQYRIFKRGDSIPGISSPIQLSTPSPPTSGENVNSGGNNNFNSFSGIDKGTVNSLSKDENNSGSSDKENSNLQGSTSTGGNIGGSSVSRTPLSQIGEIARFHSLNPSYRLTKETGPPHAPTFTVLLKLGSEEYTGEGSSIKKAQHAAAIEALEKTSLAKPPPKSKPKKPYNITGVGSKRPNWALIQLTNLSQELQLQLQFVQEPVPIVDPFRRGDPPSIVSVHVGERIFTGEGANFNAAKNMAVMVALKAMLKVKQEADLAKLVQVGADAEETMMNAENKNPISIVHEMAMKRGLSVAFSIVQEDGPAHMKVFTVNCKVGEDLITEGEGPTKQAAKKSSSELMIAKLKEIPITLPATSQGVNLKAMQRGLLRQKAPKKKTSTPVLKELEKQAISPISRLIQIAHTKKFKEPEFTLISTGTESNVESFLKQITERDRRLLRKKKPVFTIEVAVGTITCQGTGPNKKAAKKSAAEAAILALGYGPTEEAGDDATDLAEQSVPNSSSGKHSKGKHEGKNNSSTVKLAGAKQIAPGIIVLKSEPIAGAATSAAAVQEMKKVSSMMTPCPAVSTREGIDKLAYLSRLLEITVSYSDFPKKNEYLSVVSLTTNPPHVAHGCGPTLEEAQNAAALKILEELSTKGLDSVTPAPEPADS